MHQCVCGTYVYAADSCIDCSAFHCAMQTSLQINKQYLFGSRTIPGMYCNKHHLQKLSRLKAHKRWLALCLSMMLLVPRSRCHTTSTHKQNVHKYKQPIAARTSLGQNPTCQSIKPNMLLASLIALFSDSTSCTSQHCLPRWHFEAMLSTCNANYRRIALLDASLSVQARERSFSQARASPAQDLDLAAWLQNGMQQG